MAKNDNYMATELLQQLKETVQFLQKQYDGKPTVGIVLGSGLGNFVDEIEVEKEVSYGDVPHFPVSTVEGHKGKLVFGKIHGKTVVAMALLNMWPIALDVWPFIWAIIQG